MKLKCQNCGYEWDYNGKSDFYASCPRCKSSVNVNSRKVEKKED
ncbi:MAG: DUF1660 family phage protein [Petrotogales bacterium]